MLGVGFYLDENRQEILTRFFGSVKAGLGHAEPALEMAAPVLLQDISRALRKDGQTSDPWRRALLLVRSQPPGGVRGLIREFGLLRRAIHDTFAARGHAIPSDERRVLEDMLDEALALSAERWASMVRLVGARPDAAPVSRPLAPIIPAHGPGIGVAKAPVRPPPLPRRGAGGNLPGHS